jgi:hypothetical protein
MFRTYVLIVLFGCCIYYYELYTHFQRACFNGFRLCCKYFIYIFKSRSDIVNVAMDVSGRWTAAFHSRLVLLLGRRHGSRADAWGRRCLHGTHPHVAQLTRNPHGFPPCGHGWEQRRGSKRWCAMRAGTGRGGCKRGPHARATCGHVMWPNVRVIFEFLSIF